MDSAEATGPRRGAIPALRVRTVALADPGPLLELLPRTAPLSWVREGQGLVGWGEAVRCDVTGPGRFAAAAAWWAALSAAAATDDAVGQPGTGLVAFGAFEFDDRVRPLPPDPGSPGSGTARASTLIVPAVAIGRRGGTWWLTTAGPADADGPRAGLLDLSDTACDDPVQAPVGLTWADGAVAAADWPGVVARAVAAIAGGALDKAVLARDRIGQAEAPLDPRYALRRLGAAYPTCWTFCVDGLLGATPELLVRLERGRVESRVLAGTIRRPSPETPAGPLGEALRGSAKDRREHEFSVRSLVEALAPHCADLTAPEAPFVLALPNVLHLASDVSGTALAGATALDLAAAVHPTAAVCGVPADRAAALIEQLEGMDRGRYAGPVGWLSADGDGEWGVALRCGQLDRDDPARIRILAGGGIVAQSDPQAELAETEAKLAPMLGALAADDPR